MWLVSVKFHSKRSGNVPTRTQRNRDKSLASDRNGEGGNAGGDYLTLKARVCHYSGAPPEIFGRRNKERPRIVALRITVLETDVRLRKTHITLIKRVGLVQNLKPAMPDSGPVISGPIRSLKMAHVERTRWRKTLCNAPVATASTNELKDRKLRN